jgi:protein SCO1/2
LLSISIDPTFDTPKVLKDYGRRHGADFHTWSFLTGPASTVRTVAKAYSVTFWQEAGSVTHTSACAVLSPSGTLYKLYRGNTWTSEEILDDLTTLLETNKKLSVVPRARG